MGKRLRSNRAEREKKRAYAAKTRVHPDRLVARLAAESDSVVDLGELRSCGITRHGVRRREQTGRLHRLHSGVYAVGHPNVSLRGRFVAAVKACGGISPLSHRSAAAHWQILEWTEGDVEVTSWDGVDHRHAGIEVHRSSLLTRADCMVHEGILVTKPTWTVAALASVLPQETLRQVVRDALGLRLTSVSGLLALLDRLGPVRGSRVLRELLARALPTRSELEDRVLAVIRGGGFETPDVNKPLRIGERIVIPDFRWPRQRLVLEADGARWHGNALARADDAERQALLEAQGETVLRVGWDEGVLHPRRLQERLGAASAR